MRQQFLSYRHFSISPRPRPTKRQNSAKHDAHLEQEIERLKENLKKMDKTVKLLQSGGESDDTSGVDIPGKGKGTNKIRDKQRRSSETDLEEHRIRVVSDVELIKAKRQMVVQVQEMATLKDHASSLEQELAGAREALDGSTQDCEGLKEQVQKHIQKIAELQREMIDLRQYQQRVKDLSEQIRDLQLEKEELKAHAAQLLQLSANIGIRSSSDDSSNAARESLTALQQKVVSLEASLISEKAERVAMEATLKEEQHQLVQLRLKNQEMIAQQEELEKSLQTEKLSATSAKILQKQAEEMRTVNQQLESKYQILEQMLKESKRPCSRCPQLEKELKEVREPCNRCFQLEKELQNLSSHFQHSTEDPTSYKTAEESQSAFQNAAEKGDEPARRYPTLEQSRAVLGLPKRNTNSRSSAQTDAETIITPRSEEGQGDHPRKNPSSQFQVMPDVSLPATLTPTTSIQSMSLPISTFLSFYHNSRESLQGDSSNNSLHNSSKFHNFGDLDSNVSEALADSSNEVRFLETSLQLDKCREMLRVQYNLNKLYKKEIDNLAKDVTKRNIKNFNGNKR